jgi:hypothetical protein
MVYFGLAESDRKSRARDNYSPVRGGVQPLPPHIRTLYFSTEEMHHRGDELAGFNPVTAIRPDRLFETMLFGLVYL